MALSISQQQLAVPFAAGEISLVQLQNAAGLQVTLSSWGAAIWAVQLTTSKVHQLVLNYGNLADWADNPYFFGVTVGRVANRIGQARFMLGQQQIQLDANEGQNQLHGGAEGLWRRNWAVRTEQDADSVAAIFSCSSPDGDQGFPGRLDVEVCYRLTADNELHICYLAETDQLTPVSLTNHSYWNLAGAGEDVLSHQLWLDSAEILALDAEQIPTGARLAIAQSAFDFQQSKPIGQDIQQLAGGYDHYYVLKPPAAPQLRLAARLQAPSSGISMDILTTEPGIQFYSGNFLDGSKPGADGQPLSRYAGLCLEAHGYPNAVNCADFPGCLLAPGQRYQQVTVHRFRW